MEVHGEGFKSRKGSEIRWLRVEMEQQREGLLIKVGSTDPDEAELQYSCLIDKDAYLRIQKEQGIQICSNDFSKRLATLFDYCLLQMHCSCSQDSRFTFVFNEHESDSSRFKLYICEQNEFKHLVHLWLDFTQVSAEQRSMTHMSSLAIKEKMCQRYMKQKMVLT